MNLSPSAWAMSGSSLSILFLLTCVPVLVPALDQCLQSSDATKDSGWVASPGYPNDSYQNLLRCDLKVDVKSPHSLFFKFQKPFGLEKCSDCGCDKLSLIDDGIHRNHRGVFEERKTWCGTVPPPTFTSVTSGVTIEFITDGSQSSIGFNVTWKKVDRMETQCDQLLRGDSGFIRFSRDYGPSCGWNITTGREPFVEVDTRDFYDESVINDGDVMQVYDIGGDPVILIHRGSWGKYDDPPPNKLKSFGRTLRVTVDRNDTNTDVIYMQDKNTTKENTTFQWEHTRDCGGVFTEPSGHVMTYSYPYYGGVETPFPEAVNCTYDIVVPPEHHVLVKFDKPLNGECHGLQILDYSENEQRFKPRENWCHEYASNLQLRSSSSILRIAHNPDFPFEIVQFFASWTTSCGRSSSSPSGNFSVPGYGVEYPPSLDCEWVFQGSEDRPIRLDFNPAFDIQGASNNDDCDNDYVEVIDVLQGDEHRSRGKFCGLTPPPRITSSAQRMLVRFHSDSAKHGTGFSASWDTSCNDVFESRQGSIASPRYPSDYPTNFDCRWEIRASEGLAIRLTFKEPFFLEHSDSCDADYLEVYDYTTSGVLSKRGRWCGRELPPLQTSMTSRMLLVFHSDDVKSGEGFQAEWTSVNRSSFECGGVFHSPNGTLHTPGFPDTKYPPHQRCRWEIHAAEGLTLKLTFSETFDLEADKDNCRYDGVEVLESLPNGKLVSYGKWCNVWLIPVFYTTSRLVVLFYSDATKSGAGFSATWTSDPECGWPITGPAGRLVTPHYPSQYPEARHCQWEITPASHVTNDVIVHFHKQLSLEKSEDCVYDYVAIYRDGVNVGRWCGDDVIPDTSTNGTSLRVIFHSDKSGTGTGFLATLHSQP